MRTALAPALAPALAFALALLAACGDAGPEAGPDAGAQLDAGAPIDEAFVGTFGASWHQAPDCGPPAPFNTKPTLVTIAADGTIRWVPDVGDPITHHGAMDRGTLLVPEADEGNALRYKYFFSTLAVDPGNLGTRLSWKVNGSIKSCFIDLIRS